MGNYPVLWGLFHKLCIKNKDPVIKQPGWFPWKVKLGPPSFVWLVAWGSATDFVEKLQDAFDLMNRLDGSEQPEEVGETGCRGGAVEEKFKGCRKPKKRLRKWLTNGKNHVQTMWWWLMIDNFGWFCATSLHFDGLIWFDHTWKIQIHFLRWAR